MIPVVEWQPFTGCSPHSPGCANCYTMRLAGGKLRDHPSRQGLTRKGVAGHVWTGELRFNEHWIKRPLEIHTPSHIVVNAHGDLFHENAPDVWLDQVFEVMEAAIRHRFQILTKRAARMREYVVRRYVGRFAPAHIFFGVSAERQQEANERIPHLLAMPAFQRYVTFYPMLGPIRICEVPGFTRGCGITSAQAGFEPERIGDGQWITDIVRDAAEIGIVVHEGQRLQNEEAT